MIAIGKIQYKSDSMPSQFEGSTNSIRQARRAECQEWNWMPKKHWLPNMEVPKMELDAKTKLAAKSGIARLPFRRWCPSRK
jgi:hypothetical protein